VFFEAFLIYNPWILSYIPVGFAVATTGLGTGWGRVIEALASRIRGAELDIALRSLPVCCVSPWRKHICELPIYQYPVPLRPLMDGHKPAITPNGTFHHLTNFM